MRIIRKIKEMTLREALGKLKKICVVLMVINVVVLFLSAYAFILFDLALGADKVFAIAIVTMFLLLGIAILEYVTI